MALDTNCRIQENYDPVVLEVILNGNKVLKRKIREVEQKYEPTTAEEKQDWRNEMKARGTLLMALSNKLEIQGETISQEDMNLKLLRSLPSEWKTHALIWWNKVEIETISLDDLYNKLKIYELELKDSTNTSQNSQNVAFMSSNSTNSNNNRNEADNTTYGVSTAHTQSSPTSGDNLSDAVICAFLASQPNAPQMSREDLEQINPDDLEEMDLQWEMAMLTIRAMRFIKRTGRAPRNQYNKGKEPSKRTMTMESPTENALVTQDRIGGYDWSYQAEEEHPTNFALMAHTSSGSSSSLDSEVDSCSKSLSYKASLESVEARLAHYKKTEAVFEESINVLKLEVRLRDNALVENKKKLEKAEKERDELKLTLEKFQNSSKSLNNLLESQVSDKFKIGLGYNAATAVENFVNSSQMLENQEYNRSKGYHAVPPPYIGNFIPLKPDLTFIDKIVESENMDITTVITPSDFEKDVSNYESAGLKNNGDAVEPKTVRENCFIPPIIEDWNSDDESEIGYTVRSSIEKIRFVNTVRVKDTTTRDRAVVSENKGKWANTVKASACWVWKAKNSSASNTFKKYSYIDARDTVGSKPTVNHPRPISNAYKKDIHKSQDQHMTRNKCYLTEYEDYDGGFVSIGYGKGRISGKGKFKTGKLDFDNVYFCKKLKYNLFSVSRICDKKNNVLFTDTECLVLSYDFKLLDESQVLQRVPRKDNIYSVDLKSVVPTKGLTCLIAKATFDESNL
ncbi:hypothetical protein Tco_0525082 [Tanacetum coccineum]